MDYLQIFPIIISVLALLVSMSTFYLQEIRKKRHGTVSVLWASWERRHKSTTLDVKVDLAFSNQGNRPYVVSRVLLLQKRPDRNKTVFEPSAEKLYEGKPLHIASHSVEYVQLTYEIPIEYLRSENNVHFKPDDANVELLFYASDDQGVEYYASPAIMKLSIDLSDSIFYESLKVKTNLIGKENLKEWKQNTP